MCPYPHIKFFIKTSFFKFYSNNICAITDQFTIILNSLSGYVSLSSHKILFKNLFFYYSIIHAPVQQICHPVAADLLFADVAKEGVGCDGAVGTAIGHLLDKVQQGLGQGARVARDDVNHRLKHTQQLQVRRINSHLVCE